MMRTAKYKHLALAILMMCFIGQALASTSVLCQNPSMPMQSHEQMMASDMVDHSQHMSSLDEMVITDCCPDCDCNMASCTSVALPTNQLLTISQLQSIHGLYHESTGYQLTSSLYRPPITC